MAQLYFFFCYEEALEITSKLIYHQSYVHITQTSELKKIYN